MANGSHDFEAVIAYLRDIRRRGGQWGDTVITWRGQEISYVRNERGYQPGELPSAAVKATT